MCVRLSPENSPSGWKEIFEDIENCQQQHILAQRFNEVTGLSVFDREYIQSIPLEQWEKILQEATMLAKSELEVKQTVEGLAKAAADLEKEDNPELLRQMFADCFAEIKKVGIDKFKKEYMAEPEE